MTHGNIQIVIKFYRQTIDNKKSNKACEKYDTNINGENYPSRQIFHCEKLLPKIAVF